jgi:hypothetical protein
MMNNDRAYDKRTSLIERFYKEEKEGLPIAEAAVKDLQKYESNSAVSTGAGEMDWRGKNGGVRNLGVGISTEFLTKGYINLTGKEVNSPAQLAAIAQVYRDPRFETLRFIYTKGNTIVGHEGITSKLPAAAVAFLNLPDRDNCLNEYEFLRRNKTAQLKFFMNMLNRMERLNADGYFLLHNHCSGINVKPSPEDINVTVMYQGALPGFKGHVIINSNQYSFIDRSLWVTISPLDMGKDNLLEPSLPHPLLGKSIDSSEILARLAKSMQLEPKYSVVLYMSAKNRVRAIQEVPDGLFRNEKECVNFLRGRMSEFGASRVFAVTNSQQVKEMAYDMVKKGYLLDAIITDKDYTATSVRESGISPSEVQNSYWMGRKTNRGSKVREEIGDNYSLNHNANLNTLKPNRGKMPAPGINI